MSVVKVFIVAGQSNADGRGNYMQLNPVPTWAQNVGDGWTGAPTVSSDPPNTQYQQPTATNLPYMFMENNSGVLADDPPGFGPYMGQNPANAPFHPGGQSFYGPELSFAWNYRNVFPNDSVAFVKCVLGGSGDLDWLPPNSQSVGGNAAAGVMWPQLVDMINKATAALAGQTIIWGGLIWMQGENGAGNVYPYLNPTPGQTYADQLRFFFAAVRALTSPTMPVAIGRISNSMEAPAIIAAAVANDSQYTAAQYIAAMEYRRSLQVEVGGDPNNCWWDNDNLPVNTGDAPAYAYHFTSAGYLAMGERAWKAYEVLAGVVPPPPSLPTSLSVTLTLNGQAASFAPGDSITFSAGPNNTLVAAVKQGGTVINNQTPYNISLTATQG